MTRSSYLVDRPLLRLLLLALMGLALASRLALGATMPTADAAHAADPLAQLQAAMILCQPGRDQAPAPTAPQAPLLSDLLLFDQADNAHAVASEPVATSPLARHWSAVAFMARHAAPPPPLWPPIRPARGPPAAL